MKGLKNNFAQRGVRSQTSADSWEVGANIIILIIMNDNRNHKKIVMIIIIIVKYEG